MLIYRVHESPDANAFEDFFDLAKSLGFSLPPNPGHADIQKLADETGGFVGDSLEMAMFGNKTEAKTLIVAGVRFMGETAKIINHQKNVLINSNKK